MTVSAVAVDDPVQASTINHLISHVNTSPGRAVFTSNGTWSVPEGVHKFRVYLSAGGAGGHPATVGGGGEDSYLIPGEVGNDAHLASCDFAGVDIGTSYAIVIGAGGSGFNGTGGTTSFGAGFSATGANSSNKGSVTFPGAGLVPMYHGSNRYMRSNGTSYGGGGPGGGAGVYDGSGYAGIVVIEW